MKRLISTLIASLACMALLATPASAAFGIEDFDVAFSNEDGTPANQAGSHPFAMTTSFDVASKEGPGGITIVDEPPKTLEFEQITGLAGNPTAVPQCKTADFLAVIAFVFTECANSSAVGTVAVTVGGDGSAGTVHSPVYNLQPPPGVAAKIGFVTSGVPTAVELGVGEASPHNVFAAVRNISQALEVVDSELTLWGVPADPAHDTLRGKCSSLAGGSTGICPANISEEPFLTVPRACEGPLTTSFRASSWLHPESWIEGLSETHDASGNPRGFGGCGRLDFGPELSAQPTNRSAESPSGLDIDVEVEDEGLVNPKGRAASDVKKAVLTLPEGVTINPSQAEGLGVCSQADFARERSGSAPGEGCPQSAKIGTVEVESPLLEGRVLRGALFVAEPYANPFGTLIALYITIREPELGVYVGLAVKVEPDPQTGRLVSTLEDLPQLPFSRFHLHFREGGRSPLVTPPRCGTYETKVVFTPWANPTQPYTTTSSFQIGSGVGGGPCPPAGVPPFAPHFEAGSVNNNAASYSPFYMRLIRRDGEQDMTKFSSVLPPGVLGKLAGISKCPETAIAAARAKSGKEELASPSCPASSEIGHVLAGAGVGEALTYVGGKIYLAGPHMGDPLSVVVITPAVAGPFDAGTVLVREALTLNPQTAEVEVDGAASDPIPHILKGIPLKVRDLRVYVDRPEFILNPTSCEESSAKATLFGGYLDVFSAADDVPVALATRYQAANCLNLGFKPKLGFKLKGGTARGAHPALTATYAPRPGDANLAGLVTRLPRSAFLDQAHIRTICTRVQFAAKACPQGARYGFIKAWTPLLDEPLQGPVYLRSSNHNLPDLVFDLHGIVDVEVATLIDSQKGGIRATVEDAPDAPLSKVVLTMQGAKKGLIVNSRDLCAHASKADVEFSGHNGKSFRAKPAMRAECGKGRKHEHRNDRLRSRGATR